MTRLSPQVLVQLARRTVERELKWTRTELHAPPIPEGAVSDDPLAELSPLDVRLIQQLGFRAYHNAATQRSDWPLPLGLTAHELALYGEGHGILHEQPESGDIFLQRAQGPSVRACRAGDDGGSQRVPQRSHDLL